MPRSQFKQPEETQVMETRFDNHHRTFLNEDDGSDSESPPSSAIFSNGSDLIPTSAHKPRKSVRKRIISVSIKEMEEARTKREMTLGSNSSFPPSDSWSWRKYGQKPIKGSPYPRAYYRCSSSKECPARKQVERSRADPTTLRVTYCCDHNHPANASRNRNQPNNSAPPKRGQPIVLQDNRKLEGETDTDERFSDDLGWLSEMEATPATLLESPFYAKTTTVVDGASFQMREEDESVFADLEELPEYSLVFRPVQINEQQVRQLTSPWCGATS